jgi:purine-binding chemotaxis protein CheW
MKEKTLLKTAVELREQFDRSFAQPPSPVAAATENLLLLRAGGRELALRVSEISAVRRCPAFTPLPGGAATLLGVGAAQGRLLGIHSLAALIGEAPDSSHLRWIVICDEAVALAFDELEGLARVAASAIHRGPEGGSTQELVELPGSRRELISLTHHLDRIRARFVHPTDNKE